ncbi:unnamed protein product [Blepharisma stoltei]|uniref:Uncharacterized protein n=1 Tax=Blepharisma stoltei TaxID=1481888 RepID=A0AAU9J7S3_9CILI|nr:unnamed protein product [Blepharisma stoltei]
MEEKRECDLDTIDIPPVGEINHRNGNCYCYLCSCGEHLCPSLTPRDRPWSKAMYSSIYQKEFISKPFSPIKPVKLEGELLHSRQKMDLRTTKQEDFCEKPLERLNKSLNIDDNHKWKPKFLATSTYSSNFQDWKTPPPLKKLPKLLTEPIDIKLKANTTYADSFSLPDKIIENKPLESPTSRIIGINDFFYGETTHRNTFKPFKREQFTIKSRNKSLDYSQTESARSQYKSTYGKDFSSSPRKRTIFTLKQVKQMQ